MSAVPGVRGYVLYAQPEGKRRRLYYQGHCGLRENNWYSRASVAHVFNSAADAESFVLHLLDLEPGMRPRFRDHNGRVDYFIAPLVVGEGVEL